MCELSDRRTPETALDSAAIARERARTQTALPFELRPGPPSFATRFRNPAPHLRRDGVLARLASNARDVVAQLLNLYLTTDAVRCDASQKTFAASVTNHVHRPARTFAASILEQLSVHSTRNPESQKQRLNILRKLLGGRRVKGNVIVARARDESVSCPKTAEKELQIFIAKFEDTLRDLLLRCGQSQDSERLCPLERSGPYRTCRQSGVPVDAPRRPTTTGVHADYDTVVRSRINARNGIRKLTRCAREVVDQ